MINFTRAFDLAWERMMVILFRPFELGKWFTIGFSAFLAGLLSGGNGFNSSFDRHSFDQSHWSASYNVQNLNSNVSHAVTSLQTEFTVYTIAGIFAFVLGFIVLIYWLGARGQFLFLDNIVRNRGAVVEPWRVYRRHGNNLFCFYLLYVVVCLVVSAPLLVLGIVMGLPLYHQHRWPEGLEIPMFVALVLVYLSITIALSVVLFLFRELGVPLMFRHGLPAWDAFRETLNLIRRHPGSLALFILLRIALFLALVVICFIVCCFSCLPRAGALSRHGSSSARADLHQVLHPRLPGATRGRSTISWTVDVRPVA